MSKPRHAGDVRQLSTWVDADVKERLTKLAEAEQKPERVVVCEAIKAHLDAKLPEEPLS